MVPLVFETLTLQNYTKLNFFIFLPKSLSLAGVSPPLRPFGLSRSISPTRSAFRDVRSNASMPFHLLIVVKRFCFLQVESKHSSDICNLSNAILHCEALRTHTADAVGIDNVMTALVKRCVLFSILGIIEVISQHCIAHPYCA